MIDYETMIKALRLSWLMRITDEDSSGFWKSYLLDNEGGLFLFQCNYDVNQINISSTFYQQYSSKILKHLRRFPLPVSQWSQCFKTRVAQHWGGRRHISVGKTVSSRNLTIFPEKFERNGVCFNDL